MTKRDRTRRAREAPSPPAAEPRPGVLRRLAALPEVAELDARVTGVLVLTSVLLALYAYFGTDDFYWAHLAGPVRGVLGTAPGPGPDMVSFWYQSLSALTLRLLIPLACIVWVFRESPREYGFRLPEPGHGWVYLAMMLAMLPVLAAVSFLPGFQRMYPIAIEAYGAGPALTFSYLLAYAVRFAAVEAFFRGFFLFALFRRFGYHAVVIMALPYCMIHFNKPFLESIGAIAAGVLLGFLALRGRSWLPGAMLHFGVALSMDLLGLLQRGPLR